MVGVKHILREANYGLPFLTKLGKSLRRMLRLYFRFS
jgi:hypothetical protein